MNDLLNKGFEKYFDSIDSRFSKVNELSDAFMAGAEVYSEEIKRLRDELSRLRDRQIADLQNEVARLKQERPSIHVERVADTVKKESIAMWEAIDSMRKLFSNKDTTDIKSQIKQQTEAMKNFMADQEEKRINKIMSEKLAELRAHNAYQEAKIAMLEKKLKSTEEALRFTDSLLDMALGK